MPETPGNKHHTVDLTTDEIALCMCAFAVASAVQSRDAHLIRIADAVYSAAVGSTGMAPLVAMLERFGEVVDGDRKARDESNVGKQFDDNMSELAALLKRRRG